MSLTYIKEYLYFFKSSMRNTSINLQPNLFGQTELRSSRCTYTSIVYSSFWAIILADGLKIIILHYDVVQKNDAVTSLHE